MNAGDPARMVDRRELWNLLDDLGGFVAWVCHGEGEPPTDALERRLDEARERARGNRGRDFPRTVGDLRLILAADLRVLLDELERP